MRKLIVLVTLVVLALVPSAFAASPIESVLLKPLHHSHVTGRITYRALGSGTEADVSLKNIPAHAIVRVLLHAGTCRRHGVSFAVVAFGRVLFHGAPVGIGTVADGGHVFVVVVNGREAACAAVPGMS